MTILSTQLFKTKIAGEFPGGLVVRIQSLVGKLRFRKPCGIVKKIINFIYKINIYKQNKKKVVYTSRYVCFLELLLQKRGESIRIVF